MTSRNKVYLRLVQYSDHADPMTLRPEDFLRVPRTGSASGRAAEIYCKSIRSHNTWLNARRVDGREKEKEGERERTATTWRI